MKKIQEIQSDLLKALDNIGLIRTDGESVSKLCKSNSIEIIKRAINDLNELIPK